MATYTTTGGAEFGNIPLDTLMVDKDAVVEIVSGSASGVVDTVSGMIATAISTAWKAGGSKAPTDLTSALLVAANEGKVYNMSASGTTDTNFIEGSGKPYTAGTDIAVINDGTASSPVYKFNVLAVQDGSVVKSVNGYTPTNGAVTIPNAVASGQTGAKDGLMSSGDKYKLNNIAAGAEVNQNAFSKIAVSGVTGTGDASSKTDTLTLVPGDNVTMSRDGKSVTINAQVPSGTVTSIQFVCGQSFSPDESGVVTISGFATTFFVDTGTAVAPTSGGTVDIHGSGGVTVSGGGDVIIVDASTVYDLASGAAATATAASGAVSGLKNYSKVNVYATSGATSYTSVEPGSNSETLALKAGDNIELTGNNTNKTVTIKTTGVVTKVNDVSPTNGAVTIAASDIVYSGTTTVGDAISGLKNFSKVTIQNYSGQTITNGALTPSSNADDTLVFRAGNNVTFAVSGTSKTVVINANSAPDLVNAAKVSGTSTLGDNSGLTVTDRTIILPKAATGGYGVAKLTNTINNSSGLAITPYAVSGAISGVNSDLATKLTASDLHSALTSGGLSPQSSYSGNTIYALVAALHAVDGVQET